MQASDPLDPRAVLGAGQGAAWQRRSPAASQARRPALTAPARDAIDGLRAGTKERPLSNKGTERYEEQAMT
jgi:hypothetical protein